MRRVRPARTVRSERPRFEILLSMSAGLIRRAAIESDDEFPVFYKASHSALDRGHHRCPRKLRQLEYVKPIKAGVEQFVVAHDQ